MRLGVLALALATTFAAAPTDAQSGSGGKVVGPTISDIEPLCLRAQMAKGVAMSAELQHIPYDSAAKQWLSSARYDKVPTREMQKVLCGQIELGMDWPMVHAAWGEPTRKTKGRTAAGTVEIWTYDDGRSVTIVNKKVAQIIEVERTGAP